MQNLIKTNIFKVKFLILKDKLFNKKINTKLVIAVTFVSLFVFLFIIPQNFYCDLTKILTDAITSAIAFLIRTIAEGLDKVLSDMGLSLQKLVFNIKDGGFSGTSILDDNLSLLRGTVLSTSLFQLYDLFVYIAEAFLGSIALFITFDFLKAANNSAHKAKLKERLIKLVISMILLLSLPTVFDILMIFNQTFIDVFKAFISDIVTPSDVSGGYLTDIFKTLAESDTTSIVYALIYLISSVLNIWLAIYYMIRDLTISFLFILAPIIIILLPYRTDLMIKWFKEMCSNIFTQAIQALVFTVIIAITKNIDGGTLYDKMFALVAFAMFIPITGIIKKMLDLEGDIGAAKSSAGLGGAIGALGVGSAAIAGIRSNFGKNKDLIGDIKNLSGEESLLKKGKFGASTESVRTGTQNMAAGASLASNTSGTIGGGRTLGVNPNNKIDSNKNYGVLTNSQDYGNNGGYTATSRARQIQGMKRQAKRELAKNVIGGMGGGIIGGSMALAGSSFGIGGALMGSRLGTEIGEAGGNVLSEGASTIKNTASEKIQDGVYGTGVRYDGENNPALNNLFKDTVVPKSINDVKSNFNKIKDNFEENKAVISINKDLSKINPSGVTGLDTTGMSEKDVKTENSALLKRNRMEREGRFQQAHRTYAKNTYDRNEWGKEPSDEDVSKVIQPVDPAISSPIPGQIPETQGVPAQSQIARQIPRPTEKVFPKEIDELKNISKQANKSILIDSGIMTSADIPNVDIPQKIDYNVPDIEIPQKAVMDMPSTDIPQSIEYGVSNMDIPGNLPSVDVPQDIDYGVSNINIPQSLNMDIPTNDMIQDIIPMNMKSVDVPQNIDYGVSNIKPTRNVARKQQQNINILGVNIQKNTNEYMNNAEYLLALKSCKDDIADIHQGNDNSQLS